MTLLGTLQYAVVQPVICTLAVILHLHSDYGEGEFNFRKGYPYAALIINTSQMVALYSLVWLYTLIKEDIKDFKPMHKFLSIKLIIFFTFWQSVILAGTTDSDERKSNQ